MPAPLRPRLADELLIGTFVGIDAPTAVETVGVSGFDYLVIDAEHTPLPIDRIADLLRAAHAVGAPALVRVPETGSYVSRVLDAGAAGVLVPRMESAADAADVVARARYAPLGFRGLGPGRGGYQGGSIPDHIAAANDGVLVAVQIETRRGLDAADEILSVPGIDAVVTGPADLSASFAVPIGSDEHRDIEGRIIDAAIAHDVAPGAVALSSEDAARLADRGARVIILGGDGMFLAQGARAAFDGVSALKNGTPAVAEVAR
jgi:2-keto-3-deoxy-L-rhamnonate aldolase RhmA